MSETKAVMWLRYYELAHVITQRLNLTRQSTILRTRVRVTSRRRVAPLRRVHRFLVLPDATWNIDMRSVLYFLIAYKTARARVYVCVTLTFCNIHFCRNFSRKIGTSLKFVYLRQILRVKKRNFSETISRKEEKCFLNI